MLYVTGSGFPQQGIGGQDLRRRVKRRSMDVGDEGHTAEYNAIIRSGTEVQTPKRAVALFARVEEHALILWVRSNDEFEL